MTERSIEFGIALRKLREAAGMSQPELGREIQRSRSSISKLEAGAVGISTDIARRCDDALEAGGALMALVPSTPGRIRKGSTPTLVGLPPATRRFVGRAPELENLRRYASDERGANVCVLSGMAGVGKTAIALQCAWEALPWFPDGALYFDFGGHTPGASRLTAHEALDNVLRALNVPSEEIPANTTGRASLYQSRLRGKSVLFIFDNVGGSEQIHTLLPAEPKCRAVVTSRDRLNGLDEAVRIQVGVLPVAEASHLFLSSAGERAAGSEAEAIARIVGFCGRLPLAVRIAAAHFQSIPGCTVEDFIRLFTATGSRLDLIDDGERSIKAVFSLSYDSLSPDERRLFGLLAVHPARAMRLSSVAALADIAPMKARALLDRLSNAHLVSYESADRIVMHDLLREFAQDRALAEIKESDRHTAVLRLIEHNLRLTESCGRRIEPLRYRVSPFSMDQTDPNTGFLDRSEAVEWVRGEWPTLVDLCHTAGSLGHHDRCWQLSSALRDYFFLAKLWDPWIDTQQAAIASAAAAGADEALAAAFSSLGIAHSDRGELDTAVTCFQQALKLYQRLQDDHGLTSTASNLAWASLYLGKYEDALAEFRIVLDSYRRLGNSRNAAITLRAIALVETELTHHHESVEHALQAYREFKSMNLPLDLVMSVNCLAWAYFNFGDLAAADKCYKQAIILAEQCGSSFEAARAMTGRGNISAVSEDLPGANEFWLRADDLYRPLEPVMNGEARVRSTMWLGGGALPGMVHGPRRS